MPDQNKKIISKYQGDKNPDKRYLKLGRKITDVVAHKIGGVTSDIGVCARYLLPKCATLLTK